MDNTINPLNFVRQLEEKYGTLPKRLSQEEEFGRIEGGRVHVEASIVAERSLGPKGQADSHATREQEEAIEQFAKENSIWIDDYKSTYGEIYKSGVESDVYLNEENITVTKVNNGIQYLSPIDFLDSYAVWNYLFPETKYKLIGFTRKDGRFAYILEQPFIQIARGSNIVELEDFFRNMGFEMSNFSKYRGAWLPKLDIWLRDLHDENAVITKNGELFFIDAIIDLNTSDKGTGGTKILNRTVYPHQ